MKHVKPILTTVLIATTSIFAFSCKKDSSTKVDSKTQTNASLDVVKASYKHSLAIKIAIRDKSGKTEQSQLNVANLETGYPFVIIELALKANELNIKTSAVKLIDPGGKEYKLKGTAAFSIENYHPLPPEKGTMFDNYPLTESDSSGAKVIVDWIQGTKDIELKAVGKGARVMLVFAAPKTDGEYKLSLPNSSPIAVKPEEESAK